MYVTVAAVWDKKAVGQEMKKAVCLHINFFRITVYYEKFYINNSPLLFFLDGLI